MASDDGRVVVGDAAGLGQDVRHGQHRAGEDQVDQILRADAEHQHVLAGPTIDGEQKRDERPGGDIGDNADIAKIRDLAYREGM